MNIGFIGTGSMGAAIEAGLGANEWSALATMSRRQAGLTPGLTR